MTVRPTVRPTVHTTVRSDERILQSDIFGREQQRTPRPDEIICSTCVVVTTSGNVPNPHSGLLIESKCVKPVARIAALASTTLPSDSRARNEPASPSSASTVQPRRTLMRGSPSTRVTMPPIASFAHSPDGTSFA